jgi:rod shape-determining protein MreD
VPLIRLKPVETAERTWPPVADVARLFAVLLVAWLLQTTVAPNIRVLGANPDFALIILVCVGLLRGSEIGAVFGFLVGTLVAVSLMEPLGVSSFVFVLVGYYAGRYAETADLSTGVAPMVSVFAGTLLADILFITAQYLLERQVPLGFTFTRVVLPSLVLNTLLAVPFYVAVRVALRGPGVLRAHETA